MDETLRDARAARQIAELGGPLVWNVKVHRVGGLSEVCRIVRIARECGARLWAGTMPESGLGSQAALAAAAMPEFVYPSDLEPSARWFGRNADVIKLTMTRRWADAGARRADCSTARRRPVRRGVAPHPRRCCDADLSPSEGTMVEYAVLVAHIGLASLGSFARSAELWLSHVNWELVGYAVLGLVALRIVTWAFKLRRLLTEGHPWRVTCTTA